MDLKVPRAQPNNVFFLPSCLCVCSPFDVEDLTPSTGNVSKASALQRRMSMYSQGTPETPTFKDHSFFVSSAWLHVYVMRNPRAVQTLQTFHGFACLSFFFPGSANRFSVCEGAELADTHACTHTHTHRGRSTKSKYRD